MRREATCTNPKYVCASERVKLIGAIDGRFPDFGHHLENEMGGLWLHPIKLLDGFWLRLVDRDAGTVDGWIAADSFVNHPWGNEFFYGNSLGHTPVRVTRVQFAPEEATGVILCYEFENPSEAKRELYLEFLARTDLRPVWFSESMGVEDGGRDRIEYRAERSLFWAKDPAHEWHVMFGASEPPREAEAGDFFGPDRTAGNGVSGRMSFSLCLAPGETRTLRFFLAGSDQSREDCLNQYNRLCSGEDFLASKRRRYEALEANTRLVTGDREFDEIFSWVKVNTDWLIQDTAAFGRGICAGLPEYPWWFGCDSFYTIQGLLAMGDAKLAGDTLLRVLEASERVNGNGRVVHEITTNGAVPNAGNTQETAQFFVAVWDYCQWTGDWSLAGRAYPYLRKSAAWLREQDDDGDGFPSGYGIIEIAGLNLEMIDTAVYTCRAYDVWARLCAREGQAAEAEEYAALAQKLKQAINSKLWSERDGLFCDAYTSYSVVEAKLPLILGKTPPELLERVSADMGALLGEKRALGDRESGWLLNRNWVINTPMEMELAEPEKAARALQRLHSPEFLGPYGMYLNALCHDATMTISTGVMAVAQGRYGYADRALELLRRMFASFSMATPGSLSEMSPDYGCFVQAWTAYAVLVPVVSCFFGVRPDAANGEIAFAPCMPADWREASLSGIRLLDGALSLACKRDGDAEVWTVRNETSFPLRAPNGTVPPHREATLIDPGGRLGTKRCPG